MYRLRKIKIEGFWNSKIIETSFHKDINIFIGRNGTGKSTFINIIQGVLSVDLELLSNLSFTNVEITLVKDKSTRKITVKKIAENLEFKLIKYKIGTKTYEVPMIDRLYKYKSSRLHPKALSSLREIKDSLNNLYNISYLSVHRDVIDDESESSYMTSKKVRVSSIQKRLRKLMSDLTSYQLRLETDANSLSKTFEKNVLQSMLYDEKTDVLDLIEKREIDKRSLKNGLQQAYIDLGVTSKETTKKINKHVDAISKTLSKLDKVQKGTIETLGVNDLIPLILLRRTESIINFTKESESKRKEIFKPISNYLELLSKFIEDKKFYIQGRGGLAVNKDGDRFFTSLLSSGEKQLIILLTEVLLQESKPFIFIADEPELSLHISWQRMILPSLGELNTNAQLIVATHSPEIVGKKRNNIIHMEKIISNG